MTTQSMQYDSVRMWTRGSAIPMDFASGSERTIEENELSTKNQTNPI